MVETEIPKSALDASVRDRLYGQYRSNQTALKPDDERRQRAPYLRRLIKRHFPRDRNSRILDLGCGSGTLLYFLREAGYTFLCGVDNSTEQIEQARMLGFSEVRQEDVFNFLSSAPSASFDVVAAFDIIEHLTKSELLLFADEIHRTLAPGGLWIIHAPNAEGFLGSRIRYSDLTHEQAFTPASIEQLGRAAGFRSSECFEDAPIAHGLKSVARLLVWKIARAFIRLYFVAETGDTGRTAIFSQNVLALVRK